MNTFFLIFIVLPALEIFLMIKIGVEIGAFNTILLIFLTAFIGVYYARIQGIQTLRSGLINLYQNKTPIYELISGASIAFAALLLIPISEQTSSVTASVLGLAVAVGRTLEKHAPCTCLRELDTSSSALNSELK